MARQLAEIMTEYAEHEASRFTAPDAQWGPTLFTRDAAGHVRAHEFHEPDDDSAVRRVQGILHDSAAAVTGLLLMVFEPPEHLLVTTTDGATHIAAKASIQRDASAPPTLGEWEEVTPGDEVATFAINLLRHALGADTLAQQAGALDEVAVMRRALDAFLQRVGADGHLVVERDDEIVLEADRLGLVELARDALDLATSHGRAGKLLDEGFRVRRVPTPPVDPI